MLLGLLPPPGQLDGQPQPNISAITLTWKAPPSLDLTGVDPDILHYEISIFNNATGVAENFTSNKTEYTYYVNEGQLRVDTCQEIDFSVLAVNSVGRGNKSDISVGLHTRMTLRVLAILSLVNLHDVAALSVQLR